MRNTTLIIFLLLSIALKAQTYEWAKSLGGTSSSDFGYSIALDASGNIYTTGSFGGIADFDPGAGTLNLTSAGESDVFVRKFDPSGNLLWAKSFGGTYFDYGIDMSVDASGNIYITGTFTETVDFDPGAGTTNISSMGLTDAFVEKLDASGNFIWVKTFGGTNYDGVVSICLDPSDNIYTTGYFSQTIDFDPGAGIVNLTSVGPSDAFIQKLDPSGNLIWAKPFGGTQTEEVRKIIADSFGNIYTTGHYEGTIDFDPNPGITNLTSLGNTDVFIQKIDTSGNFIWAKSLGGTSYDRSSSIGSDAFGNIYTLGNFALTVDFDLGPGTANLTSVGSLDAFVQKLDSSGNFIWAKSFGGNYILGLSIQIDESANIYTTGTFEGMVDFDPNTGEQYLASTGNGDVFIQKLNTSADFQWAKSFGGPASDIGRFICTDASGNVYTTGEFGYSVDFSSGLGTGILTATLNYDVFIQKLSQSTAGVDDQKENLQITAHPNPTNGIMSVAFNQTLYNVELILTDLQGQIIFRQNHSTLSYLDVKLPHSSGVYLLNINTSGESKVIRLVKE